MQQSGISAHPLDDRGALVRALEGYSWAGLSSAEHPLRALRMISDQLTAQTVSAELEAAGGRLGGNFWARYLGGGIAAVAVRAASAAISEADRPYLLAFLEVWADTVFADRTAVLRSGIVRTTTLVAADSAGAVVALDVGYQNANQVVELRRGAAEPPALGEFLDPMPLRVSWGDAEQLTALVKLVRERGPVPADPAAVQLLSESTGLSPAASALILAGQLGAADHSLRGKDLRQAGQGVAGVSAVGLSDAWLELSEFRIRNRPLVSVWAEALPHDPAELWAEHGMRDVAARFASAWNARFGRRTCVPVETLAAAQAVRDLVNRRARSAPSIATLCAAVTDVTAASSAFLSYWERSMLLCRWAYGHLPVGDPMRSGVPAAIAELRRYLRDPERLMYAGSVPAQNIAALHARAGTDPAGTFDNGLLVARGPGHGGEWSLSFRPAQYGIDERTAELHAEARGRNSLLFADLDWILGADCDAMVARIEAEGIPGGSFELDPAIGAPELTARVAAELSIDPDAAALYLQLATLVDPRDKNIRRWNRWKPARHRKAEAVLVDRGLAVPDKRDRSGRTAFLPGPWDGIYRFEGWKRELRKTYADGHTYWADGMATPQVVLSELFRRGLEAARAAARESVPVAPEPSPGVAASPAEVEHVSEGSCATDDLRVHELDDRPGIDYSLNGYARDSRRPATVLRELQIISNALRGRRLPEGVDPKHLAHTARIWQPFVTGIGAAALRAVSPVTADLDRRHLLAFLDVWADTIFADPRAELRVGSTATDVWFTANSDGAVLACPQSFEGKWFIGARYGDGEAPIPGAIHTNQRVAGRWGSAEQIRALVDSLRTHGPVPWDAAAPGEFARATGMSHACATLVLAGYIGWVVRGDRCDEQARAQLGLTELAFRDAADELLDVQRDRRTEQYAVLARALPDDPADLWRPGGLRGLAERAADGWIAAYGKRARPWERTIAEAAAFRSTMTRLDSRCSGALLCSMLMAPGSVPMLVEPLRARLDQEPGEQVHRIVGGAALRHFRRRWESTVEAARWAYSHLPAGDAVRAGAGRTLELLRAQLRSPDLLLEAHLLTAGDRMGVLMRLTGHEPVPDADGALRYDDGFICAAADSAGRWQVAFRPAGYGTDARSDWLRSSVDWWPYRPMLQYLDWMFGTDCDAMIARLAAADLPEDGYEADPRLVVPELVREVRDVLGVASDAAALYLQLLALLDPTDVNIRRWNHWTPAQHKKAADVLVAQGLVTRTRRKGAGRNTLLPGNWIKTPGFESWKLPLHGLTARRGGRSGEIDMQGAYATTSTLPELFHAAWRRVQAGDGPV